MEKDPTDEPTLIANVLAERYAGRPIKKLWSARGRIQLEREFWIAVLEAQKSLGLDIPQEAIDDYRRVKNQIDLQAIYKREQQTRHDVKARIEIFCELAGHQQIHKGLTSRDLTENIEQLQIFRSLKIIRTKAIAALLALGKRALEYQNCLITGRTHNVAAQPTTLGKRLAMFGEEFLYAIEQLDTFIQQYPVRGLKGAVGTQLDLLTLFNNNPQQVEKLENAIAEQLGLPCLLKAVGQVYPRSLDFACISRLCQLAAAPCSFAKTLRLMTGNELVSEGFARGQVGSSAMPHKINSRSCERLNGLGVILKGYLTMANEIAGDQWNEGDVSCSVVRRVMLPDSFFALDGLLETFLVILEQMEAFPSIIEQENQRYLPFLATTTFLMESVHAGMGREIAHSIIREHALATVDGLRTGKNKTNNLVERLAADQRLPLNRKQLRSALKHSEYLCGLAGQQVDHFLAAIQPWQERFPEATDVKPGSIL